MKKSLRFFPLILAALWFTAPPTHAGQSFSLTLGGQYSRNLSGLDGFDNGLGGSLLFEFQPSDAFSVGLGADLIAHFAEAPLTGQALFETVNLSLRYLPFPAKGNLRPFITAGAGLNPKIDVSGSYLWAGDFKILAGLGTWYHFSPQWALEIAALFNYYDSPGGSIQTLNGRLGLTCFFGRGQDKAEAKEASAKTLSLEETPTPDATAEATPTPTPKIQARSEGLLTSKPVRAEPGKKKAPVEEWDEEEDLEEEAPAKEEVPAPKPKASGEPVESAKKEAVVLPKGPKPTPTVSVKPLAYYVFREGDNFWDIAARKDVYGNPELYPLLVDANFKATSPDTKVDPGTKLVIPRGLTMKENMGARMKAWALEYKRWRGKTIDRKIYEQWVEEQEWLRLHPKESPTIEEKSWEIRPVEEPYNIQ